MLYWKLLYGVIVLILSANCKALSIEPTFLFVDEDWPLDKPLQLNICPYQKDIKILHGDPQNIFRIVKINETCATLQLQKPLDADALNVDGIKWQSFSLVLGDEYNKKNLEIQVIDVNDNSPVFQHMLSIFDVSEKAAVGTAISTVKTFDPDTGIGGISKFSIEDDRFSMDRSQCAQSYCTTTIRIARELDFELQATINTVILAQDGAGRTRESNEARLPIRISILDEQDTPPIFLDEFSKININMIRAVGQKITQVRATDGDKSAALTNAIKYAINENDFFDIDPISGWITVKQMPSLNSTSFISLKVKATEESSEQMWTTKVYTVGEFDRLLACEKELYDFRMEGDADEFALDRKIHVYSKDYANFNISTSDEHSNIIISPTTVNHYGDLSLALRSALHSQSLGLHRFNITLHLETALNPTVTGSCTVQITILYGNAHRLRFQDNRTQIVVLENRDPHLFASFKAVYDGSEQSLVVNYKISGTESESFRIDHDGGLFTVDVIDREAVAEYHITVEATDANNHDNKILRNLVIVVADENDNAPRFIRDVYDIVIDEESESNFSVKAVDMDAGRNGSIYYSFIGDVPTGVSIKKKTGDIHFPKIDADSANVVNFVLTVSASDLGPVPLYSFANIRISIEDLNDNSPTFSNSSSVISITRNTVGIVAKVEAHDFDRSAPNNQFQFKLEEVVFGFSVDPASGNIHLEKSLPPSVDYVDLNVLAIDNGVPQLQGKKLMRFYVNESVSAFNFLSERNLQLEIFENTPIGAVIYEPHVALPLPEVVFELDDTVNVTWNGQIRNPEKWFNMDRTNGRIYLTKMLDAEAIDQLNISFVLRNKIGGLIDRGYLSIVVKDVNDNWPVFEHLMYVARVGEEELLGYKVLTIKVTDMDRIDRIRYSLVAISESNDFFVIDQSGTISVAAKLNSRVASPINISVLAQDEVGHIAAANVSIYILERITSRIQSEKLVKFDAMIEESAAVGAILNLRYPLLHSSRVPHGKLVYSVATRTEFFSIDSVTSEITLVNPLDFEKQRTHDLLVEVFEASVGGTSFYAHVQIYVKVLDVNDNSPTLQTELSLINLPEDATLGSLITRFHAYDADSGENGRVSFHTKYNTDLFTLSEDGDLIVSSLLIGQSGSMLCPLIEIHDNGVPQLNSSTTLCIQITPWASHFNVTDISPNDNSVHYFDENTQYEALLTIKIRPQNGFIDAKNVNFSFEESIDQGWKEFKIDKNGAISTSRQFDYERQKLYLLKINICMSNNCVTLNIFIAVNDKNDLCPEFQQHEFHLSILENLAANDNGTLVGEFPCATDYDGSRQHQSVCYEIVHDDSRYTPFYIEANSSTRILVNDSLDRERFAEHRLTVITHDCKSSCNDSRETINNRLALIIHVEDANDNFPRFQRKVFHGAVIQGHSKLGENVLKLLAFDADLEANQLVYRINGPMKRNREVIPNERLPLVLNGNSGEISSNLYMEMDKSACYSFHVTVNDRVAHQDEASVTISVVGYEEQLELIFDQNSTEISRNSEKIAELVSHSTNLLAVIHSIVPSLNSTVMIIHFIDNDMSLVPIRTALKRFNSAASSTQQKARNILQNQFKLRARFQYEHPAVHQDMLDFVIPLICMLVALTTCLIVYVFVTYWRHNNRYKQQLKQFSTASYIQSIRAPMRLERKLPIKRSTPLWMRLNFDIDEMNRKQLNIADLQSTAL